jgi:cytochrome c-type biogenesis protein CcmH
MGMALAQSGHLTEARAVWAGLLARSPANAPYRLDLAEKLARLDQLIAMSSGQAPNGSAPGAPAAPVAKAPAAAPAGR